MIARTSSGSSRAEIAVEPTRSQNITVSWRRSAASGFGAGSAAGRSAAGRPADSSRIARNSFLPSIAEDDAEFLQVLVGEFGKHREIDAIFSEALGVIGHAEPFELGRDLAVAVVHGLSSPSNASGAPEPSEFGQTIRL